LLKNTALQCLKLDQSGKYETAEKDELVVLGEKRGGESARRRYNYLNWNGRLWQTSMSPMAFLFLHFSQMKFSKGYGN
jgi:hypothetical protein